MSELIQEFKEFFQDCEIVSLGENISPKEVSELYLSLLDQGKLEKFHPIIVSDIANLLEKFELDLEDEDLDFSNQGMISLRKKILEESKQIDAKNYYNKEKEEIKESLDDVVFEGGGGEDVVFVSCLDLLDSKGETLKEDVVILKIPTDKPFEVFSWLPIGGFNECPTSGFLIAISKYWYEKYGAIPATISFDTVEFYVPNPPTSKEQLYDLGIEQYLFDIDIVDQGVGDVETLIKTLYKNKHWYFWWD